MFLLRSFSWCISAVLQSFWCWTKQWCLPLFSAAYHPVPIPINVFMQAIKKGKALKARTLDICFTFLFTAPRRNQVLRIFSQLYCAMLGKKGLGTYNAMNFPSGFDMVFLGFGLAWVQEPFMVSGVFTKAIGPCIFKFVFEKTGLGLPIPVYC